jgi:fatty acid desaturase
MHVRAALYPIFASEGGTCTLSRRRSAWIGTPLAMFFHIYLWQQGVLLPHVISGALLLHFLSMSDSFHHTYEAFMMKDYKPGPGDRTAKFEEENTYSNVISTSFPWLNTLVLNFGYHNAHHKKPMVPWYALPDYHDKLYGGLLTEASMKQVLPVQDVLHAWVIHRVRRVLEEDYGVVHPPGTPGRADDFIGTLGVSFLTV